MKAAPLRLIARQPDELTVFSAMLQDAAVKVGDIAWLPKERRFAAALNRYRWEDRSRRLDRTGTRVRSGLHLDFVLKAQTQGLPLDQPDQVLGLLAITHEPLDGGGYAIVLSFSGGAAVRLEAECIEAVLEDLSTPWTAKARPEHRPD